MKLVSKELEERFTEFSEKKFTEEEKEKFNRYHIRNVVFIALGFSIIVSYLTLYLYSKL